MKTKTKVKSEMKLALLILTLLFSCAIQSQSTESEPDVDSHRWKFLVEPYVLFPNMSGYVGIGDKLEDAEVDASTGDIFNNLKMGFMLNAEASNGTWAIGSDFLYMNLTKDIRSGKLIEDGEVTAKQMGWEFSGLRRVTPWLEVGLGALINSIQAELDLELKEIGEGTRMVNKSKTETWVDPMVIARIKSSLEEKFVYHFRGEIGGFGIGSDFAWQLQAYAGYRFSALFHMTAGYRIISLDYENGKGEDRFRYDVDTSGPVISFGFNF